MRSLKLKKSIKTPIEKIGKVLFYLITLFFIVLSVICFSLAFQNLCPVSKLTSFLDNINRYGNIFTITIALITVGLVLSQITLAVEANKLTPRSNWTDSFEKFFNNKKSTSQKISPMIQTYFLKNSDDIFDYLYNLQTPLKIANARELTDFFNTFLKGKVREFELDSDGYHQNHKTYKSFGSSYSLTDIQKIIPFILKPTGNYQMLENDLSDLYLAEVNKMIEENKLKS